ncbi:hypothetical protein [Eubacterium xylanophilum]|uniref:hypothetical protein n=1 Tax=Eubacterium xylanophilum TaxID=39497 RepID=UPI00047BE439|nr:hypothetical protein [Eubacterium xylanophilum]
MGLFRRKKKKTNTAPELNTDTIELQIEEPKLERENVDIKKKSQRLEYIQRLYEEIQDEKQQMERVKVEYSRVTESLKDIQCIDQCYPEERATIRDIASTIYELSRERNERMKHLVKLAEDQRSALQKYEEDVEHDLGSLREYEDYFTRLKSDMRQLTSEKHMLVEDKTEIMQRQGLLKKVSKVLALLACLFTIMIGIIFKVYKSDITIPFILIVVFTLVFALLIVSEARKNRTDMIITDKKLNRAIYLLNKVKVKYVNTSKTLNYLCRKYRVKDHIELEYVWGQHLKLNREMARQREESFILSEKNDQLVNCLHNIGVKDKEIWFYQAKALVDPREMVEIRHELNEKRQLLRDQLEYNRNVMQNYLEEIDRIREMNPEYEKDVEFVLKKAL